MDRMVAVVIPLGNNDKLSLLERISLEQVNKILKHHTKIFVAPKSLAFDFGDEYKEYKTERFDECYFGSTESHSKLLLSEEFYSRFLQYEYILIYHLDAFVFSDKLMDFCQLDFDYIGSPVSKFMGGWHDIDSYVGNGGFSLRRVKSFLRILQDKDDLCLHHSLGKLFYKTEDLFWAFCGTKEKLNFKVPSIQIALRFSIEYNVRHCYGRLEKNLPFGTHGWYKGRFLIWKKFIQKYGYNIEEIKDEIKPWENWKIRKLNMGLVPNYIIIRSKRKENQNTLRTVLSEILNPKQLYSLWGMGLDGKRCLELLSLGGIGIFSLWDGMRNGDVHIEGCSVHKPTMSELLKKQSVIIITTSKYEHDIAIYLRSIGFIEKKDFLFFSQVEEMFLQTYMHNIYHNIRN